MSAIAVQVAPNAKPAADHYFSTLYSGVEAWFRHLEAKLKLKGYELWHYEDNHPIDFDETFSDTWAAMRYETNQSDSYRFVKQGSTKSGNPRLYEKFLHIDVYRMPSGNYEVTAYVG